MRVDAFSGVYGQSQDEIRQLVQIEVSPQTAGAVQQTSEVPQEIDLLFTRWGGPRSEEAFLQVPQLGAVFCGGGTAYPVVTPEFWERNIPITSADANAIPVAEYTLDERGSISRAHCARVINCYDVLFAVNDVLC